MSGKASVTSQQLRLISPSTHPCITFSLLVSSQSVNQKRPGHVSMLVNQVQDIILSTKILWSEDILIRSLGSGNAVT